MSHNKITVAGQSPNSSGNISIDSLNISDLGDVTISSASSDQVIKYDGSGWVNSSSPSGSLVLLPFAYRFDSIYY